MASGRDWSDAVAHHQGRPCRVSYYLKFDHKGPLDEQLQDVLDGDRVWTLDNPGPRELAHVAPRKNDPLDRKRGVRVVHRSAVAPLARVWHQAYDRHALNLLPYLERAEVEHAFEAVGSGQALHYIGGPDAAALQQLPEREVLDQAGSRLRWQ